MTIKLDKSRPFGVVFPEYEGAHFAQDGYHFDVEGRVVEALLTPELRKKMEAAQRVAEARAKADAAFTAALEEAGVDPAEVAPAKPARQPARDGNADGVTETVDLGKWLRGESKFQWFAVAGAIKQEYGRTVTNKADAVDFLVDEIGLVASGSVKI
jgi:hypothetical protein